MFRAACVIACFAWLVCQGSLDSEEQQRLDRVVELAQASMFIVSFIRHDL